MLHNEYKDKKRTENGRKSVKLYLNETRESN